MRSLGTTDHTIFQHDFCIVSPKQRSISKTDRWPRKWQRRGGKFCLFFAFCPASPSLVICTLIGCSRRCLAHVFSLENVYGVDKYYIVGVFEHCIVAFTHGDWSLPIKCKVACDQGFLSPASKTGIELCCVNKAQSGTWCLVWPYFSLILIYTCSWLKWETITENLLFFFFFSWIAGFNLGLLCESDQPEQTWLCGRSLKTQFIRLSNGTCNYNM